MKRFSLAVICLVVMGLVASASLVYAAGPVDISGKWTMDVVTPKVTGIAVFTFQQDGEKLTGTYAGSLGEAPVTGTIKGNNAVFQFTLASALKKDPNAKPAIYTGKVDGNKMSGDIDFAGQVKGTFTGKKIVKK